MAGGSLRVLQLLPPLKLFAMIDIAEILMKVALNTRNEIYFKKGSKWSNIYKVFKEFFIFPPTFSLN
jgi:hypothetical protein